VARTKRKDSGSESTKFTEEKLRALAKDLQTGRLPLERTQVSDDMVAGLRAAINKSGRISFHASYYVGDKRPFLDIGELDPRSPDHISLADAREITKTIKALGDKGINVQDGLHRRLLRELKRDGVKWRLEK
jgi:hypothetical protein